MQVKLKRKLAGRNRLKLTKLAFSESTQDEDDAKNPASDYHTEFGEDTAYERR